MSEPKAEDQRLFFPATARNRDAIAEVIGPRLQDRRCVLEIASGSGEHVVHFATRFAESHPQLRWQPSDLEAEHLDSIAAWSEHAARERGAPLPVLAPLQIDVHARPWPIADEARPDAIFCANMIHIAPASASEALFAGAGELLPPGAPLLLYGPFMRDGAHTAPSNARFDESLRGRDPRWGVRDVAWLESLADAGELELRESIEMPANNAILVFRRR